MFKGDGNKNESYLRNRVKSDVITKGKLSLWKQVDQARMEAAANDQNGVIRPARQNDEF